MRLILFASLAMMAFQPVTVEATTLTNRITGIDQNATTTVLYCAGAHCHSVYGYIYGDPTTVTGSLSRSVPAARGNTWKYAGSVVAACQPDASVVGFELACSW